jgi:hypothetical protein
MTQEFRDQTENGEVVVIDKAKIAKLRAVLAKQNLSVLERIRLVLPEGILTESELSEIELD